jgi:UDP-arabinose 4-epimerase
MQRNVLVTGGAGYIGSHCCKALAKAGYLPITYDNLVTGHAEAVKWGPLEIGDLSNSDRLRNIITQYSPIATIHLAGFTYVGESVLNPAKYYKNNVIDSLVYLDTLIETKIKNIIFSSSCATYGLPQTIPITEEVNQKPINPYGMTKLIFENAIKDYSAAYGVKYNILRYFNAAGADPDGDLGEQHDPETHAIPLAIWAALGRSSKFKIFGDDYSTPDGTAVRDYVHVSDLADAHVASLNYLLNVGKNDAFNIGTGIGTSVREITKVVSNVTSREVPIAIMPRRDGDPPILLASAERAKEVLGWKPQRSEIREIVKTATKWYLKRH